MTRSFKYLYIFTIPILFLGVLACDKDKTTTINGIVVDKVTGFPLKNTFVEFRVLHKDVPAPNNIELYDINTDEDGKFVFQSEDPVSVYWVDKSGYLPKGLGTPVVDIEQGKENDVVINMIPKDGILKLCLNSSGVHDTLYLGIYSHIQESELNLSYGFILNSFYTFPNIATQDVFVNLASEETVSIFWSFSPWPNYSSIKLASGRETVAIQRNDTSIVSIVF